MPNLLIYIGTREGIKKVDAKAGRGKSNWPVGESTHIEEDVFYILVYLQTPSNIKSNVAPEYFVVSGKEILKENLIHSWEGGRRGIKYKDLKKPEYEERWDKLGLPEDAVNLSFYRQVVKISFDDIHFLEKRGAEPVIVD